jgi:hypothetical protein
VSRRILDGQEAVQAAEDAAAWLRRVDRRLFPATEQPDHPANLHLLAIRADVRRLHKRLAAAGVPPVEIAAEVRACLIAEGLERIVVRVDAQAVA